MCMYMHDVRTYNVHTTFFSPPPSFHPSLSERMTYRVSSLIWGRGRLPCSRQPVTVRSRWEENPKSSLRLLTSHHIHVPPSLYTLSTCTWLACGQHLHAAIRVLYRRGGCRCITSQLYTLSTRLPSHARGSGARDRSFPSICLTIAANECTYLQPLCAQSFPCLQILYKYLAIATWNYQRTTTS